MRRWVSLTCDSCSRCLFHPAVQLILTLALGACTSVSLVGSVVGLSLTAPGTLLWLVAVVLAVAAVVSAFLIGASVVLFHPLVSGPAQSQYRPPPPPTFVTPLLANSNEMCG